MIDELDSEDYQTLLAAVFRQAIDDYIKLQHPKNRNKKYLIEAFENAVDMFFDEEYRLLNIKNEDGEDMSLEDMIKIIANTDQVDLDQIKQFIVSESVNFWAGKEISTIEIPDSVIVNGFVYRVQHEEISEYAIDYDERIIVLNKLPASINQEQFVMAVTEIIFYHEDLTMSRKKREQLATSWFRTLKVNNCFTGLGS